MGDQKLSPLSAQESAWVDSILRILGRHRLLGDADALTNYFYSYRKRWFAKRVADREDPNQVIKMVGIGIGQLFVDEFEMHWMVVSDDYGTELAVSADLGQVLVFPLNGVGKRWPETVPDDELDRYIDQVAESVHDLRAQRWQLDAETVSPDEPVVSLYDTQG